MAWKGLERALKIGEGKKFKEYSRRVAHINDLETDAQELEDAEIKEEIADLKKRIQEGDSLDIVLPWSFALTREAAKRTLGMRHFDVQLIGGMALHEGSIAEMRTGEGKTLTATLAVVLNALAGKGVHVVTVNDYLAQRDAEWMRPIYEALGLSVGILQSEEFDPEIKRVAYAADITYGTNSEFGFDFLRDNLAMTLDEKVQHGGRHNSGVRTSHNYAIVDEVDNILIDEARTPLIISGRPTQAADLYYKFAKLAKTMKLGEKPENFDPRIHKDYIADYDYEIDEKHKTVSVTEQGSEKAEKFLGIDNMFLAEHGNLFNHLLQSLKAESLYKKDVDYAVIDDGDGPEVKIIDEFTGRILEGRRWSEGLHQAVEAKEGVRIQEENQTVATITYQNYFRRYDKLAGMSGTATTEATEFMKIYGIQVVEIPTNKPMIRKDQNDQIYKTRDGKWNAVVSEIAARHEKGQPVLVGTISVEVSELLSSRLKKKGIQHSVLNAKPEHAHKEGDTVAEAGRPGAVTIATNMAGRGVDIKLGGNAEHLTDLQLRKRKLKPGNEDYKQEWDQVYKQMEEQVETDSQRVRDAGGLFILGTERHESRRIDNQLRGRAGRQGDPGESRFYISAQDDLIRLFAGDRIYNVLNRLGPQDDEGNEEALEHKMLSKQIEAAQKKVEEQNFLIRKRVLEYDDVLNQQREVIYSYRDRILEGEDISEAALEQIGYAVTRMAEEYMPGDHPEEWDLEGLFNQLEQLYPTALTVEEFDSKNVNKQETIQEIQEDAEEAYKERESELGDEIMRGLERFVLLQIIDERWREHLHDMDYLREGIHLRSFAQIDPLIAYKNEGYVMFEQLVQGIWEEFTRFIFHVEAQMDDEPLGKLTPSSHTNNAITSLQYQATNAPSALAAAAVGLNPEEVALESTEPAPSIATRRVSEEERIGRNDPCWCGSGRKFKKCHGAG